MEKNFITKEQFDEMLKDSLGGIVEGAIKDALHAQVADKSEKDVDKQLERIGDVIRRRKFEIRPDQKGVAAARMVRALAFAKGNVERAKHFIDKVYNDDLGDEVKKAFISSELTDGGAMVVPEYAAEIIELLRARTTVRRAGARVVPMNNGTLTIRKQTAGSTVGYVGESRNIGVTQPEVGQIEMTAKKLAAIVPISNDLLVLNSGAEADMFIRDDLVTEISIREDRAFLRDDGTSHTPRGMRHWAIGGNVSVSNGITPADIEADFKDLLNALEGANVRMISPAWFMHPRRKNYLAILRHAGGGQLLFPTLSGPNPNIWGYPVLTTTSLPANLGSSGLQTEIMFADMADAIIGEVSGLVIDVDSSASYVENGTAQSAFSRDETLVRAIARHDFAMRHRESVAVKTEVDWG